ncbi:MAG: hypothetical protein JW955_21350 [Sedimentisphaerales bacterium]|nr:hypothetical protein [Sedimentisphaerales bacterium]
MTSGMAGPHQPARNSRPVADETSKIKDQKSESIAKRFRSFDFCILTFDLPSVGARAKKAGMSPAFLLWLDFCRMHIGPIFFKEILSNVHSAKVWTD